MRLRALRVHRGLHLQSIFTPSKMESTTEEIHGSLNQVVDGQTHFRLREAKGRVFAEDLNQRVFYWSVGETVFILLLGIGQVFVLRSFFTDKKGYNSIPITS